MLKEQHPRRSRFRKGPTLPLGDGRLWTFPAAFEPGDAGFGPEYRGLLEALADSADGPERRKAELALAIYLLDWNYDLEPEDYGRVLGEGADPETARRLDSSLRSLATEHLAPPDHPTRSGFSRGPLGFFQGIAARFGLRAPLARAAGRRP